MQAICYGRILPLPPHVPHIQWSSKRRDHRTGLSIFALTQVQLHRPAAGRRNTHRHTGRHSALIQWSSSSAGMLSTLTTVNVPLASLQNAGVWDHAYHTQKKKSLCSVSRVRYHLGNVCCIPAGVKYHLCTVRDSQLHENQQLSSLSSISLGVSSVLIEGLAHVHSFS